MTKKFQNLNLSESLEDYLEAIYLLAKQDKVARSKDIADKLNVAKSSVTGALRQLADRELINYKPYGYITLTEKGKEVAQWVSKKHGIIEAFLVEVLAVSPDLAEVAACKVEHAFGQDIISKILLFQDFLELKENDGFNVKSDFKNYISKLR